MGEKSVGSHTSRPSVLGSAQARLGVWIARHRRDRLPHALAAFCRRYLAWHSNVCYELADNGEAFVLDQLARFQPRVVLDVGANVGDWTSEVVARCPAAQIHAFEISPSTFETLRARTSELSSVQTHGVGLSDREGTIMVRHCDEFPALTTATDYPHPFEFREVQARVTTGDAYVVEQGIEHIDFLKIDVEGMEDRVLRGFTEQFEKRAIDVVQFEYGRVNILSKFLLRDYHELFESWGYRIGKIYPNYVDFRSYDLADEDFLGPNYLACPADRGDLLEAFNCPRH